MFRKLLFAGMGLGALAGSHLAGASSSARPARPANPSLGRKLMFTGVGLGVLGCLAFYGT